MMKVLLDTNIILDIALKRDPYYDLSLKVFNLIDQKKIWAFIKASTVSDIYYISRKLEGKEIALQFIVNLIQIVDIIGVDKGIIFNALKSGLSDFEDAIQVSAAEFNRIKVIVTRNKQDFSKSKLTILNPMELAERYS